MWPPTNSALCFHETRIDATPCPLTAVIFDLNSLPNVSRQQRQQQQQQQQQQHGREREHEQTKSTPNDLLAPRAPLGMLAMAPPGQRCERQSNGHLVALPRRRQSTLSPLSNIRHLSATLNGIRLPNATHPPQTVLIVVLLSDRRTRTQNLTVCQLGATTTTIAMERTIKTLLTETNQHVANSFNEQTLKLAQSIKSILANMTNAHANQCRQQSTGSELEPESKQKTMNAQHDELNNDNNNNDQPRNVDLVTCCSDSELDWPGSFIQLLNSLAHKQQQQQRQQRQRQQQLVMESPSETKCNPLVASSSQTATNSAANRMGDREHSTGSSSVSSLAIDDRDFELIALPCLTNDHLQTPVETDHNDNHHNHHHHNNNKRALNANANANTNLADEKQSVWLMDFLTASPASVQTLDDVSLPVAGTKTNSIVNSTSNDTDDLQHDKKIINLMRFLCKKSASELCSKWTATKPDDAFRGPITRSLPNQHLKRSNTLPPSNLLANFNQITIVELDHFKSDLKSKTNSKSNLQQQQQQTLESLETKKDFEDEDDNDEGPRSVLAGPKLASDEEHQFEQHDRSSTAGTSQLGGHSQIHHSEENNNNNNNDDDDDNDNSQSQETTSPSQRKTDDGKYSMLQFALYNFREAIDKYSLENRLSIRGQRDVNGNSKQSPSSQPSDDWSTLRGSLKLIESLRSGRTASSSSSSAGAGAGAGGSAPQADQSNESTTNSSRSLTEAASGCGGPTSPANTNSTEWTWRELAEMVKFTAAPPRRSLLKLSPQASCRQTASNSSQVKVSAQELERRAVDCFGAIMRYMGDLDSPVPHKSSSSQASGNSSASSKQLQQIPDNEVECVYLILINCHNHPQLRDEVYCQLIKQTTNNRSARQDSCLRGWRLFSLLAAYFDCSSHFKPYLLNYLEQNAFDKRRSYHSIALLCLQNLRKTFKYGGRKNVPSIEEIAALSAGRISKRQIYRLPGGTERVINTKSTTVVEDIIHEICSNMLGVKEANEMLEFSLYCIADGDLYTMPLNRDEYILDITTELIKNHQQYFLIFCRSIWHYPLRLDNKLYIEVTFNQIAPDYLEGLLLVLPKCQRPRASSGGNYATTGARSTSSTSTSSNNATDSPPASQLATQANLKLSGKLIKEIARLAALLHKASSGTDYMPHREEIKYLLPKPIVSTIKAQLRASKSAAQDYLKSELKKQEDTVHQDQEAVPIPSQLGWTELVQNYWREMSSFDTLDAKAQFLDIIRHWALFGSSFFAIKLIQRDLIQPTDFILALNKLGVQMLDTQTHETRHKYSFNEVLSTRKVRNEDGALYLDMKCGHLMKRTIIRIQTDQAHEISRLIRQYIDIELMQSSQALAQQHSQGNGATQTAVEGEAQSRAQSSGSSAIGSD